MPSNRSTRRNSGLPRKDAEDTTTMTTESRPDPPAYEPIEGGDTDRHRHDGTRTHAHADPPHWHDGDQVVPLHDYPAAADAALYGTEPNPDNPPYERPRLDGPHPIDPLEGALSDTIVPPEQHNTPPLDTPQVAGEAAGRAVAEAERHTLGANGLPTDPAGRDKLRAELRSSLDYLDNTEPTVPAVPVREGVSRTGTSIAHPGTLSLLNTIHHVTDDALNHEMAWTTILAPLVIEAVTYHADNRAEGGSGPELAPMELWMRARDAMEHIIQPRLQAQGGR
jgi:hypothetical protein